MTSPAILDDSDTATENVTAEAARELTDRIKTHVEQAWELIKQAYATRAWTALGYATWDDYCAAEFDRARIRVPREERPEVVASLREIGMSTRAIAAATGLSQPTVRRDLSSAVSGESFDSPDTVTGIDGKTYEPRSAETEPTWAEDSPDDEDVATPVQDSGTEGDGPRTSTRKRAPLTESFDAARRDLLKDSQRLARLAEDDRFDRHAEQLAHRHRADLIRAQAALQAVIDRLPTATDHPEER